MCGEKNDKQREHTKQSQGTVLHDVVRQLRATGMTRGEIRKFVSETVNSEVESLDKLPE